jgi:hypothetical protein
MAVSEWATSEYKDESGSSAEENGQPAFALDGLRRGEGSMSNIQRSMSNADKAVNHDRSDDLYHVMKSFAFGAFLLIAAITAQAQPGSHEPLGIAMENYDHPHPLKFFPLKIKGHKRSGLV